MSQSYISILEGEASEFSFNPYPVQTTSISSPIPDDNINMVQIKPTNLYYVTPEIVLQSPFFSPNNSLITTSSCIDLINANSSDSIRVELLNNSDDLLEFIELLPGETMSLGWVDGVPFINPFACCLHPDTAVQTVGGIKAVADIVSGNYIYRNNKEIKIINNIKFLGRRDDFIKISKNAFGDNLPENDIFLTSGHPIQLNDQEVQPKDLIYGDKIKKVTLEKMTVYSLLTEERTYFDVEGLGVYTWGREDWEKYVAENHPCFVLL